MYATIKKIGLFCAVLLIVCALGVDCAHAQSSATPTKSALAVSPAILEEVLEPGKPTPIVLHVSNVTHFPLPIKTMARDFIVQSQQLEKTQRKRLDASQWFTITDPDFILQPKQTRTVKGILQAPADAEPGGHYATIYFQPLIPQQALSPATAYMNSQVGVLAFLSVKGDIIKEAAYAKPLSVPRLVQGGPVDFTFSLKNTGSVHVMPTGKLTIYDWRNKVVKQFTLPVGMILPDSVKEYTFAWQDPPFLGKYRAELQVAYSNDAQPLQNSAVTFWVMPWATIFGVIFGGGAVLIFVIKTRHRWARAWRALHGKDMRFGS